MATKSALHTMIPTTHTNNTNHKSTSKSHVIGNLVSVFDLIVNDI